MGTEAKEEIGTERRASSNPHSARFIQLFWPDLEPTSITMPGKIGYFLQKNRGILVRRNFSGMTIFPMQKKSDPTCILGIDSKHNSANV